MNTRNYSDVWVCVDCYFAHHYGAREIDGQWWTGPDFDAASHEPCDCEPGALLAGLDTSDNVDAETEEGVLTFTWSACQGCGSTLGGSRYRLAMFDNTESLEG